MNLGNAFKVLRGGIGNPILVAERAFHLNKNGFYGLAATVPADCSRRGPIVGADHS